MHSKNLIFSINQYFSSWTLAFSPLAYLVFMGYLNTLSAAEGICPEWAFSPQKQRAFINLKLAWAATSNNLPALWWLAGASQGLTKCCSTRGFHEKQSCPVALKSYPHLVSGNLLFTPVFPSGLIDSTCSPLPPVCVYSPCFPFSGAVCLMRSV